ncbi:VIR protein [Plasmodium vivax]|uniref:VIR protein n=1 Tax=Plasmodium vivax TaxID=5855 RepID=A0A1G4EDE9_PLAVI|nr:VIR protein [Plasmodium vivax]
MGECSHSDNEYLHYNCYNKLYKYFTNDSIFPNNEEKLKIISPNIDIRSYQKKEQKQIFSKLYHYMSGNGAFLKQDEIECCRYINYWLNNNVRKELPDLYSANTFKILKDIVNLYNKNNKGNERCINNIDYIDTTLLGKMVALYNLYDNYYFLTIKYTPYRYTACDLIDQASGIFKDTINQHGGNDNNLLTRLKEFKPLMDSIVPNYTCSSSYRTNFIIPERFSEPKVREPENQDKTHETSAHQLVSSSEREKQQILDSHGQSSDSEVNLLSETVTLEREDEASGGSRLVTGTLSQEDLLGYSQLSHSLDGRLAVGENSIEGRYSVGGSLSERRDSVKVRHLHEGEHNDFLQDRNLFNLRGHTSATESLGLQTTVGQQSEDPGVLGKMRTAFTDIVQNVDPAPVLGVSGGMGVLFILFKYTPVGSFFGGRRGRFRQIPRSFNGPFPGDFGNFQEYDGGYIGYGPMNMNPLAE